MQYQFVPVFISNEEGHLQCAMTTFGFWNEMKFLTIILPKIVFHESALQEAI